MTGSSVYQRDRSADIFARYRLGPGRTASISRELLSAKSPALGGWRIEGTLRASDTQGFSLNRGAYQDQTQAAQLTLGKYLTPKLFVSYGVSLFQPGQTFRLLYDLGHGFCTYSFFEQCPHRMACARCDFYTPKASSKAQLLEAKENLQRMLASVPLTDDEQAAVDEGQAALDHLLERLIDVATPDGATPREIGVPATATLLPIITVNQGQIGHELDKSDST